ncbi:MAG TPA: glycosyltransferase [Phycisphaerae bacterium]|nr:glycosyltransferase [Phycisphaerae bacterium]
MIEGRNIVCIASNWAADPTSKHHIMRLVAERNEIVWVNYHGSRRPRASAADAGAIVGKLRQVIEGPRRVAERITVVTPLVAPLPGSRVVAALNKRLLVRQIKRVIRDLPPRPVQVWSFAPDVDFLCGSFDEEFFVYYCVDEFSEFEGYDRDAILSAEARLAAKADLVVVTSQALCEAKQRLNPRVVLVTHGVDYEHFAKARRGEVVIPEEIAKLPRPILGFWGLIEGWVDVDLIAAMARARPHWSIVLIGRFTADVSALEELANVHLLGRRPYEQLPAYARGFDAGLIPFRVNELTRAVNPIKLREYLSAGLPVVSTPMPEVERYGPHVSIASDAAEFVAACERMIAENSPGKILERQTAMQRETWQSKVEEVCSLIRPPRPVSLHRSPS